MSPAAIVYPGIRLDRAEPMVSLGAESSGNVGTMPRARPWGFVIEANAQTRTVAVSGPFSGPALILEILYRNIGQGTNLGGFGLFWDTSDGGAKNSSADVTAPPGTRVFAPSSVTVTSVANNENIPETIPSIAPGTDTIFPTVIRPRYVINVTGQFFLKVTIKGGNAGTLHTRGVITVVEAASVEELRTFW